MTHNSNHLPATSIDIVQIEGEKVLVPVTTKEAIGAVAMTQVTLEGNREDGGYLRNVETGEAMVSLAGSQESDDNERAA